MARPLCEGKRSLTRTTTLLPVAGKVTFTRVHEGPVGVGGGQGVLVEHLAARGLLAVVAGAVPGRDALDDGADHQLIPLGGKA